MQTRRIRN